jgi:trehalose/maltose transport system permease protein
VVAAGPAPAAPARRGAAAGRPSALPGRGPGLAWLFLAPTVVAMAGVAGWPLARTVWLGLTDTSLVDPGAARFVGLASFRFVLTDPDWWHAVWNTVRFAVVSVALETALGMLIALALHLRFRGRGVARALALLPWAIPTVVAARLWEWMLQDRYGVVNEVLLRAGLLSEPLAFTAEPGLALLAAVAVDVWKTTPFMTLLILAALQLIPEDVYEAGRLDGATGGTAFLRLTLPILRGPLMVAVTFRMLDAFRVFDVLFVLTGDSPATMPMAGYARQRMFEFQELGVGSAAATLLFAMIALFTTVYLVVGRVRVDGPA